MLAKRRDTRMRARFFHCREQGTSYEVPTPLYKVRVPGADCTCKLCVVHGRHSANNPTNGTEFFTAVLLAVCTITPWFQASTFFATSASSARPLSIGTTRRLHPPQCCSSHVWHGRSSPSPSYQPLGTRLPLTSHPSKPGEHANNSSSSRTFTSLTPLRPSLSPLRPGITSFTPAPSSSPTAALDLVPKTAISQHPALFGAAQLRCGPRNTMNGHSRRIQKRRSGFLTRTRTRTGRKILLRRKLKGRRIVGAAS